MTAPTPAAAFARRHVVHLLFACIVVVLTAGLSYAWWTTQSTGTASATTATLAAPTDVAGSVSGTDVTVTWTGVTGPNALPVTGYYVVRYAGATPSAACGSSPVSLLPATPTSCVDSAADGTYTYRVVAVFHSWTATSDPSDEVTVSADAVAPTVLSINRAGASPTNDASVSWTVTFSESVTGVDETDFVLSVSGVSGTSVTGVTGSGTTWTVTASTGSGDGTLGLILSDDDTIVDGNANKLGGTGISGAGDGSLVGQAYTVDKTAPTVTVEQADGQADPTNGATIHFTALFSEPVAGLIGEDFSITGSASGGASASVSGSGTTFDVAVTVGTSGTVVVALPASAADDLAGNASTASTSVDNEVTRDAVAPTVTIDQASSQADPTNASPIHFTVTFSKPVSGFEDTDVTLDGSAGATTAVVSGTGPYDVAVSGMTSDGTVIATIDAGVAIDALGNANAASTTSDNIVVRDTVAPTIAGLTAMGSSPTNDDPLSWIVTFSEEVNGVTTSSFGVTTANTSGAAPTVSSAVPTGGAPTATWIVNVATAGTVGANDGSVRLDLTSTSGIVDEATNALSATVPVTGDAYAFDTTAPTVTSVTRDLASPTNDASVTWTVTYSEPVLGVSLADFTLASSGLTAPSLTNVTAVTSATYTVTASTGSGSGTLGLNVGNGSSLDAAGNTLNGAFTGQVYAVDKVAPTVASVTRNDPATNNLSSVSWTVTFSESVTGVGTADFALANTGLSSPSITSVTGGPTAYTVTASTGSGSGTLGLNVLDDDTVLDTAENALAAGFTGPTYSVDNLGPAVSSVNRTDASPTNTSSVSWTVTFSESVSGVDSADFALVNGGLTAPSITSVSGGGAIWTVTASTGTGSGTLGLNFVDDDTVVDLAGNKAGGTGVNNGNFTGQVYTVDKVVPTGVTVSCAFTSGSNYTCSGAAGNASGDSTTVSLIIVQVSNNTTVSGPHVFTRSGATWTSGTSLSNLANNTNFQAKLTQTDSAGNSTTVTSATFSR